MSKKRLDDIDALKKIAGLGSRKEVLDNALSMFKWAIDQTEKGRAIVSLADDEKSYRELAMPCFDNVRGKK